MVNGDKPSSAEYAAEARAHAEEAAEAAEAALRDGLDEAYVYLKRQLDERPLTMLAATLGAGVLLGLLLGRR